MKVPKHYELEVSACRQYFLKSGYAQTSQTSSEVQELCFYPVRVQELRAQQ